MKRFYLKFVVISLLLSFIAFLSIAQRSNGLAVEGKISVEQGSVEGAIIQMYQDGRRLDNYGVKADGRYKVELNYNHKYELIFELKDNFSQKIAVETAVPKTILQSDPKFPPFPVDVNLFTEIPGIDKSFSEKTVLKIYYSPNVDNFISELYYNNAQIKKLIDQAILQSKMIGKEADYLSKLTRAEIAELRKEYNQLLEQAGEEYSKEKFLAALDGFKAASKIFPKEQFPKDRIAEINDLLGIIMAASELDEALTKRFASLISDADSLFKQEKYSDARNLYNRALSIKPTDSYVLQQVSLINDLLNKQQTETQYNDLIAQGDNSFRQILYNEAIVKYRDALKLKPNEAYPKTKIEEINGILADQAKNLEKQENYKQAIFHAESLFEKQFYEKAMASYQNALNYKPGDTAATQKVDEVRAIMKEIADRLQFDKFVKAADKSYKKKLFPEALNNYSEAFALFPDEPHPKERIQEINKILDLKENFADLVYKADNQFISENYDASKSLYQQALEIHSDDKHSIDRIREIDGLLASQSLEGRYTALVAQADDLFSGDNYENAKSKYTEALVLKPREKYPKDKVAEINSILQQIAKTNQRYQPAIARADGLFQRQDYAKAKTAFVDAGKIKPDETYPLEMIGKIDGLVAEQARILAEKQAVEQARLTAEAAAEQVRLEEAAAAETARLAALQAEKDKNYTDAIARADDLFKQTEYGKSRNEYRLALTIKPGETYPQQQIEEIGTLLAQLSAAQKAYEDAVKRGDNEFRREGFDAAITAFNDAKAAKADETYPDEMLAKIDSIVTNRARLAEEAAAAEAARLAALQAEKDKNYTDAITRADDLFKQTEYEKSRNEYRSALTIKPGETYPQQRIDEIGTLLAQLSAAQKAYEDAVKRGDNEFRREGFDAAITAFNDAKAAKADETYPDEMLAKIDSIVTNRARLAEEAAAAKAARLAALQAEKDKNYTDAIARADDLFKQTEYEKSRNEYRSALTIKPGETYPQQRIDEIGTLLAQLSAAQKAYEDAVKRGDNEFRREGFDAAITAFNDAKAAKADETYPDEMLAKIDSIVTNRARLAEEAAAAEAARLAALQAEKDKNYTDAITRADDLFKQTEYEKSLNEYRSALKIKPGETYPQQRIDEIIKKLYELELARKAQELLDKNYANLIQQADRFFAASNYTQAKGKYENALDLKAEESYPKQKIVEIEQLLQQQKLDEQYRSIIVVADGLFRTKSYRQAKMEYEKALTLKTKEQYPKNQISKIVDILQKEQQQILSEKQAAEDLKRRTEQIAQINSEIDAQNVESEAGLTDLYNQFIQKADALFTIKQYNVSRAWYYQALDIKPNEPHPNQRIEEINSLVGSLLLSQLDRDYQGFIDLADSTFRSNELAVARGWYNRALGVKANESYPKDKIAEINDKIAERMAGKAGQQFEANVAKAAKAFDEKNYNVARFWYKKALELRPNDEAVKNRLIEIGEALK